MLPLDDATAKGRGQGARGLRPSPPTWTLAFLKYYEFGEFYSDLGYFCRALGYFYRAAYSCRSE